jgi:hypothetical protein
MAEPVAIGAACFMLIGYVLTSPTDRTPGRIIIQGYGMEKDCVDGMATAINEFQKQNNVRVVGAQCKRFRTKDPVCPFGEAV